MKDDHNDEDDLDDDDDEDEEVDDDDDDVNIHVSFKDTSLELDDEEDEDDEDDTEDIDNDELLLNVDANRDGGAASASETCPPSDSILKKDASRSSSGSGKSVKGSVTFAMDVLQDVDDYDEERDQQQQQRTTTQLLDKISRLQKSLREAQIKCETERQRSKKKGKNLVKLAKELKKRQHQKERDADRLEEVRVHMQCVICTLVWRYPHGDGCNDAGAGSYFSSLTILFTYGSTGSVKSFHGRCPNSWRKRKSIWSIIGYSHRKN